ncbi:hypothetical protein DID76_03025 [Candidatus Marinamargulisbacteria bacterium SCGC AG-414-C22]|nr:hypothetical protein DID76_03025 [Candidatus Marinamargulisbacteria bacterium SCGC AG-414-C22]
MSSKKCDCSNFVPNQCKAYCCGPVPMHKNVYFKHKHKCYREVKDELWLEDDMILPDTQQQYCTFLGPDYKCLIYDDRPDPCKLFGKSDSPLLQCPFMDKNGKKRSSEERKVVEIEFEQALKMVQSGVDENDIQSFF